MSRTFTDSEAKRESVPLIIGLGGPSSSGKTYSALRLAAGIQRVVGGDIFGIDTEAKRMLHYSDAFKFRHVPFVAPFGPLDYLEAITYCVRQGAKTIIIDSMSHEHEGQGGVLDIHEQELERMAGSDYAKRERSKMAAWIKPKAERRKLIQGILQLGVNVVFCFRAKETAKPIRGANKTEIVDMGFVPIAPSELVFEMTLMCLLLPGCKGVPTWHSDFLGEQAMIKLPLQFEQVFKSGPQLSEDVGERLALWARGDKPKSELLDIPALEKKGFEAAKLGVESLKNFWVSIPPAAKIALKGIQESDWKPAAEAADAEKAKT